MLPRCDMTEEEIFHQARARTDPELRAAYLDQACGGDAALRASVEALLRADVGATGFMDRPPPDPDATADPPTGERPGTVIGPYKLIKAGMDSRQVIARFEAERQALALMDHPNIAKVLDAGATAAGRPYFIMDL